MNRKEAARAGTPNGRHRMHRGKLDSSQNRSILFHDARFHAGIFLRIPAISATDSEGLRPPVPKESGR
jgi:hypothetical protein